MDAKVQLVIRQTNYTEEEARHKLLMHDYDEIKCIKEYLGIDVVSSTPKKTEHPSIPSVNQQIYKEIRKKLECVPK